MAELIDLVTPGPDGADGLDPILTLHAAGDHAGAEDVVQARLGRLIPEMTQLLRKTTLVLDYMLVVSRDDEAECWAGARRPYRTPIAMVGSEVAEAHPLLIARDGQLCVDLCAVVNHLPGRKGGRVLAA